MPHRPLRRALCALIVCAATGAAADEPLAPAAPASAASAGPFADGLRAFDAGRYDEAFRLWLPLAEQGRSQAQFNVAFLYEKGLGVEKNDAEAARWYAAAAERGDAAAKARVAQLREAGVVAAAAPTSVQPLDPADVMPFEGGRYVLSGARGGACVIALQGNVTRDTSRSFDGVVRKARDRGCVEPITLLLESPGGLVDAGIEIGRSVHAEGMRTVARYACASSCANIFLGGTERILWGSRAQIGLHQPSFVRPGAEPGERDCVAGHFETPVLAMRNYLRYVLPDSADRVMEIVTSTPCKTITYVRGERAVWLGVATRIEAERQDVFGPAARRMAPAASASR